MTHPNTSVVVRGEKRGFEPGKFNWKIVSQFSVLFLWLSFHVHWFFEERKQF